MPFLFRPVCALLTLLLLSGKTAYGAWVSVDGKTEEGETVYVDSATIHRNGDVVSLWVLIDFTTTQTVPMPSYLSVKSHREIDCGEAHIRLLASTAFSGNMGTGEALYSYANPKDEGIPIEAGSVAQTLWKVFCAGPGP